MIDECTSETFQRTEDVGSRVNWRCRALPLFTLVLLVTLCGCNNRRTTGGDLTLKAEQSALLSRQTTPTEIQASVMAFADQFSSRAADVFDIVHDQAQSSAERLDARRARVSVGLGAITIATEVNPVAALLDMVTMVRLKSMSFRDHSAQLFSSRSAELIQAMYNQSENEVWVLAGRFLTQEQQDQLRGVIDEWYANNPDVRTASYIRLQDFTTFRRESPWGTRSAPTSVLRLLYLDPMSGMDPIAREVQETRLFSERAMFFAKRIPPLIFWQVQAATADLLATPELNSVLTTTSQIGEASDRFAASTERFTAVLEQFAGTLQTIPQDFDQTVASAVEGLHAVVSAERATAIEQSAAAISAQREALMKDIDAFEGGVRSVISDVNKTLIESQVTAQAVSQSAQEAVTSAHHSARDVVDHAYYRALSLFIFMLIGIPVVMILYRYAAKRSIGPRQPGA